MEYFLKKMQSITIIKPDDMHTHLREGAMLKNVVKHSNSFGKVVVMGNLTKPVITGQDIKNYKKEISKYNPKFKPIMAVMLVQSTTPEILKKVYDAGAKLLKLIPGGTSTNSSQGVRFEAVYKYYSVLEMAQKLNMVLSIHAELDQDANGKNIAEKSREKAAIPYLRQIVKDFPKLKIVIEHVTTKEMIDFIKKAPQNVAATITVHHATITQNDVFDSKGEVKDAFNYCKPVAKSEQNRQAVIGAMTSGNPKFFFGSDSAPHPLNKKTGKRPAAGIFSAPVAIQLLCQIFDKANKIDYLEDFTSRFGAEFYGLPVNKERIEIIKKEWTIPNKYNNIVPFWAGQRIKFLIMNNE